MEKTNTDTVNAIIAEAYRHTCDMIPSVLVGAAEKHGNCSSAGGSHFIKGFESQHEIEAEFFDRKMGEWREVFRSDEDNLLIAEMSIDDDIAVLAAAPLEKIPAHQKCVVKALGGHPTLATIGDSVPAKVLTVIIELDGSLDPDLDGLTEPGKPIIATWFPGKSLPPSRPHDCEVGDILTAAEAISKGWKVASLVDDLK